ncbi:MAG: glycosyltransferase family 2 protein [Desulfobacterales bacterium]|nr:glycosyltransferase family 2 protein [Desulfobacterales bacterium]
MKSLDALLKNRVLPDEIIVVDQGRAEATARALDELGQARIVHVPSTETGLSRARNTGIRASCFPIIGFIDDDCIPAENWLAAAHEVIEKLPESHVWIGEVYNTVEDICKTAQAESPARTFSLRGRNDPWRLGPSGGNAFFRRSVFDLVGEFDPLLGQGSDFPGAEDGDMVYRVMKEGLQVTYTNTIRAFHPDWRNDEEEIKNAHNYGMGVGAMLAKFAAQGDYYPATVVFGRNFLSRYPGVPYNLLLGRMVKCRINLEWSRSIIQGFAGWRARHRKGASR